jgi:sulfate adenylyltransferase subunit 2
VDPGESIRVFPLSNWTELDVWEYIHAERIPVVPLYFAKERWVLERGDSLISLEQDFVPRLPGEKPTLVRCRMRSLGCSPCTGAIRSDADTVPKIVEELIGFRRSEREKRRSSKSSNSLKRSARRTCCGSPPRAAWTTANPR